MPLCTQAPRRRPSHLLDKFLFFFFPFFPHLDLLQAMVTPRRCASPFAGGHPHRAALPHPIHPPRLAFLPLYMHGVRWPSPPFVHGLRPVCLPLPPFTRPSMAETQEGLCVPFCLRAPSACCPSALMPGGARGIVRPFPPFTPPPCSSQPFARRREGAPLPARVLPAPSGLLGRARTPLLSNACHPTTVQAPSGLLGLLLDPPGSNGERPRADVL
jgi:hypothetical protein